MEAASGGGDVSRPQQGLWSRPQNPLQPEEFEKFALSASGFANVRPALAPAESGDAKMQVIPFQTISWYPRITYYPGGAGPPAALQVECGRP